MTKEERQHIIEILRQETGCGMSLISTCLDTLIDKLNHKPIQKMDVGQRLRMYWEEYDMRKRKD